MNDLTETIEVVVTETGRCTDDTCVFRLARPDGTRLPTYQPGSHIDVHLPGGLVRQYSLCGPDALASEYRIAVKREAASRGGSAWLHDHARAGTRLWIGPPRNAFALNEAAGHHMLVAGGIGVTPILSMAYGLQASGRSYQLDYFTRSETAAVFHEEFARPPLAAHARVHPGLSPADARERVAGLLASAARDSHLYVCGPSAFMRMVVELGHAVLGKERVHQESFGPIAPDVDTERPFAVRLNDRRETIPVPVGKSVLTCLREAGFHIASSCEVGVCGTCMMRVLAGEPDHRDTYLTDDERAEGTCFLPCVSRSKSPVIVLANEA